MTDRWHWSKCFILHEKIIDFISDHSSLRDILLSLTHDKQIFESSNKSCSDMKSDHLVNEKKEDKYKVKDKKAEWKNKEKFNDDCNKSKMSLLFFIKKDADLSLVRDLRRSDELNVIAVRYLIEMKLSIIKMSVKCTFLVQEVNDCLIFYRYFNCSSESERQYSEWWCFFCKMQYRQYSFILSSILESLISFCIITEFKTVFTQRWCCKINDRSDYFVMNVELNASYSH